MSDAERRRRERAGDGGELEAAAALLLERVRAGELAEELLALCAYLGHAPAQLALGPATPVGEFAPVAKLAGALAEERARAFWLLAVRFACGEFASRVGSIHDEVLSDLERLSRWCAAPEGEAPALGRREEFLTYWRPWMTQVPIGEVLAIFDLAAAPGPAAGAIWWDLAPLRGRDEWQARFGPEAVPLLLGEPYRAESGLRPSEETTWPIESGAGRSRGSACPWPGSRVTPPRSPPAGWPRTRSAS